MTAFAEAFDTALEARLRADSVLLTLVPKAAATGPGLHHRMARRYLAMPCIAYWWTSAYPDPALPGLFHTQALVVDAYAMTRSAAAQMVERIRELLCVPAPPATETTPGPWVVEGFTDPVQRLECVSVLDDVSGENVNRKTMQFRGLVYERRTPVLAP